MRALLLLAVLLAVPATAQPLTIRYTLTSPLPPGPNNGFGGFDPTSDLNGDSAEDFAVRAGNGQTISILFTSGITGDTFRTISAPLNGGLGLGFAELSDATGDGIPDFVFGAPYEERNFPFGRFQVGAAYLYDGATGALRWDVLSPDPEEFADFGFAAAPLGDIDGDGRADVLVSESGYGNLYAFSGATGAYLYTVDALDGTGILGQVLVAVGDLDGDGVTEVVTEGSRDSPRGRLFVISGATGVIVREIASTGEELNAGFGRRLSRAGDLDGDGLADIVTSALAETVDGVERAGRVYAISAATGAVIRTFEAPPADVAADSVRFFGLAVAGGADLDGDDVPDVAATALRSAPAFRRIYLFSGATGEVIGTAESEHPERYSEYGFQLALLGGWGGRLVVPDPNEDVDGVPDAGRVYVYGLSPVESAPGPEASGLAVVVSPNPSAGAASVTLTVASAQAVRVVVVDALGRVVAVLHDGPVSAGSVRVSLPAGLAPGVYAVAAEGAGASASARWVVAR